jgi:hypothetical protein
MLFFFYSAFSSHAVANALVLRNDALAGYGWGSILTVP